MGNVNSNINIQFKTISISIPISNSRQYQVSMFYVHLCQGAHCQMLSTLIVVWLVCTLVQCTMYDIQCTVCKVQRGECTHDALWICLPVANIWASIARTTTASNGQKNMIFKNWLDTRPKMETHDPNVYQTILGGVSRGFWTPFLNRGAQSAIFWHLKTGTFAVKIPIPFAMA